jgi:DNA-binding NarL/FixJ family response regulator
MMRPPADDDEFTVFLIDGWPAFRRSLRLFVEAAGHRVVGEADTVEEAAATISLGAADVVIIDPGAGWGDLIADLSTLRGAAPSTGVVLLTAEPLASSVVAQALQRGVGAYLTKSAGPADVLNAIAIALSRSFVVLPRHLLAAATLYERPQFTGPQLTRREVEILTLAAEGHSDRRIADVLWIAEQSVRFHLANVFRKLGVANRTAAIQWAERYGLIRRWRLWPDIPPDRGQAA